MVISRKLSLLFSSISSVKVRLGCMELKSSSMDCMFVCVKNRKSAGYHQYIGSS